VFGFSFIHPDEPDREFTRNAPRPCEIGARRTSGLILSDGRILAYPTYEGLSTFREGLARYVRDGKAGFIDPTGREVIPARYDDARSFHEGLACVMLDGKWGYVDRNGHIVIKPQYDRADDFSEGLAAVGVGPPGAGAFGAVDCKGRVMVPFQYDNISSFHGGLAEVHKGRHFGYVDRTGRTVIPVTLRATTAFKNERAVVETSERTCAVIDTTGRILTSRPYKESFWEYSDGRLAMQADEGWGYVDEDGKEIIPCQYRYVKPFEQGLAGVRLWQTAKWGVIDRTGNMVLDAKYDALGVLSMGRASVNVGGTPSDIDTRKTHGGKWGYITRSGEIVIPPIYDSARPFWPCGLAHVRLGDNHYIIDRSGRYATYVFSVNQDDSAVVPASTFDYLPDDCPRLSPSPAELMAPAE